jgi:hyperosmotically inducible protein
MKIVGSVTLIIASVIVLFSSMTFADAGNSMDATSPINAGAMMPDTDTMTNVKAAIAGDSSLTGANITVAAKNGVITLDGSVDNQAQADSAMKDAKSVAGTQEVNSNIKITHP